tara:strand:- start:7493 stop:8881 length:1389 start_codon:yes stop_codon:yes gene_type:complete
MNIISLEDLILISINVLLFYIIQTYFFSNLADKLGIHNISKLINDADLAMQKNTYGKLNVKSLFKLTDDDINDINNNKKKRDVKNRKILTPIYNMIKIGGVSLIIALFVLPNTETSSLKFDNSFKFRPILTTIFKPTNLVLILITFLIYGTELYLFLRVMKRYNFIQLYDLFTDEVGYNKYKLKNHKNDNNQLNNSFIDKEVKLFNTFTFLVNQYYIFNKRLKAGSTVRDAIPDFLLENVENKLESDIQDEINEKTNAENNAEIINEVVDVLNTNPDLTNELTGIDNVENVDNTIDNVENVDNIKENFLSKKKSLSKNLKNELKYNKNITPIIIETYKQYISVNKDTNKLYDNDFINKINNINKDYSYDDIVKKTFEKYNNTDDINIIKTIDSNLNFYTNKKINKKIKENFTKNKIKKIVKNISNDVINDIHNVLKENKNIEINLFNISNKIITDIENHVNN